jgi:two-component system CheB/CheR fusion protein
MLDQVNDGLDAKAAGFPVVGIGASAGGLVALERFFRAIPPAPDMAFVVVQHLSPDFKSLMVELLARFTSLPSHRVEQGMCIVPNAIFLIPAGMNMTLRHGRFVLSARDTTGPVHHPVNVFLESLAREMGPRSYAVILSGTGTDGAIGVNHIQAAGGVVLVQAPESADFDGMPRAAATEVEPSCIDTPENLARFIFGVPPIPSPSAVEHAGEEAGEESFGEVSAHSVGHAQIFDRIGKMSGLDFRQYKLATVGRRLDRRMSVNKFTDLAAYVEYLQRDPHEWSALYKDLLIGVTHFFRDPDAFEILGRDILPALFMERDPQEEVRIWVAGCATGEEAYSLAIQCDEVAQKMAHRPRVRVFATDVHREAIELASQGLYSEEQMLEVSPERRLRYFEEANQGWRVTPALRRMVVFAEHNLLADAPFTRMDLVSCRNLLIYLRPEAQARVLQGLYFALRRGGTLFLEPSEGLGLLEGTLSPIDRHWNLYTKEHDGPPPRGLQHRPVPRPARGNAPILRPDLFSNKGRVDRAIRLMMEHLAPSGFLITRQRELLYTFGAAGRYLAPRGPATEDLLALLPKELRTGVGSAIQRALQSGAAVQLDRVRVEADPAVYHRLSVEPLSGGSQAESLLFVRLERTEMPQSDPPPPEFFSQDDAIATHIGDLERELQELRENLQTTVEELETTNEELQAANEEMLAANEELQSTNEELQSVNEELYTVNAEYERKNEELIQANEDLNNLIECTDIGTVFLDKNLCIRKFTPSISSTFNLRTQDINRPLLDIAPRLLTDGSSLLEDICTVLESGQTREREVLNTLGTTLLQRIHPYRDELGQVQGAALTYVNLDLVKEAEAKIIAAEQFLGAVLNSISANVAVLNAEGTIIATNNAWLDFATSNAASNLATLEVGANYFGACICAAEDGAFLDAQKALSGIIGSAERPPAPF